MSESSVRSRSSIRKMSIAVVAASVIAGATLLTGTSARAATVLDGPVDLGTAATYGVLAASAVTNTGPTVVNGDLGLSPQTSITGLDGAPDGSVVGTIHATDVPAAEAQSDLTVAYDVAASLTPQLSGLAELSGLSLSPGVYSGGSLQIADTGSLTLAGDADSVWVFQAASSLIIGSGADIVITGGASACNVFWQVGSSATIGTAAEFQGTVMAAQSITATTGATVIGRLLARAGAVTLDTNVITVPTDCAAAAEPEETTSPEVTSEAPPSATVGTPYDFTITATGEPAPTFTVTGGSLPAGITLDESGRLSGTPTGEGTSSFTVTASNGVGPDAAAIYTIASAAAVVPTPSPEPTPQPSVTATPAPSVAPIVPSATVRPSARAAELANTGTGGDLPSIIAAALLLGGIAVLTAAPLITRARRPRHLRG